MTNISATEWTKVIDSRPDNVELRHEISDAYRLIYIAVTVNAVLVVHNISQ